MGFNSGFKGLIISQQNVFQHVTLHCDRVISYRQRTLHSYQAPVVILIVGLRPLACCDRGFESHREHGCLSVVSVVWCQVEVSATS